MNTYFTITHALARMIAKKGRTSRTSRTNKEKSMKKTFIYEIEKQQIIEKPMDSASYEKEIRKLAKKLKI